MASASPLTDVEEDLECPICMENLSDPVSVECGHNFCRDCIIQYCEIWEDLGDLACPLCKRRIKKGNFRPNWQLANIVEKFKLLPINPGKEDLCVRHKEKLHLFCKEDNKLLCLFCERSPEHRSHTVLLLEEAAEELKADFQEHLRTLVNQQERIGRLKIDTKEESQDLFKQVTAEKEKAVTVFRQLHQFLKEQEMLLLTQLEKAEKQIARRRDERMAMLSKEHSSLESLIQEMQEKLNQSARDLLKNVGYTMQRYKTRRALENLEGFPDESKLSSQKFLGITSFLENETKRFKATLQSGLQQHNATPATDSEGLGNLDSARLRLCKNWAKKKLHPKSLRQTSIYPDPFRGVPSSSVLQQLSKEDSVRREENSRGGWSAKKSSTGIRIYGSESD